METVKWESEVKMGTATIRRATLDDLEAVVKLAHRLGLDDAGTYGIATNLSWASEHGRDAYTRSISDERAVVLLAEERDDPIGYLFGRLNEPSTWRTARIAEIVTLYVVAARRDRGVGERLVRAFFDWARANQADRAAVSAYAQNQGALRFYQRVGFAPYEVMLETVLD